MSKIPIITIGTIIGVFTVFLEAVISYADTASPFEEGLGFDIPNMNFFIYKLLIYALIGFVSAWTSYEIIKKIVQIIISQIKK